MIIIIIVRSRVRMWQIGLTIFIAGHRFDSVNGLQSIIKMMSRPKKSFMAALLSRIRARRLHRYNGDLVKNGRPSYHQQQLYHGAVDVALVPSEAERQG